MRDHSRFGGLWGFGILLSLYWGLGLQSLDDLGLRIRMIRAWVLGLSAFGIFP